MPSMDKKLRTSHNMIQAKERGNPKIRGSGDEKGKYPGQTTAMAATSSTIRKKTLPGLRVKAKQCFDEIPGNFSNF